MEKEFREWYIDVLKKYTVFTGRARRKEYWMFTLFNLIISIAISIVAQLFAKIPVIGLIFGLLPLIYAIAVLLPSLAVAIRRLHDTNRSGWFLLLALIPILGVIILIIFFVQEGTPGDNQYGANPKA
ncbi:MAG: DUF805 domain-containing protein [Leptospirales bacterium]|nr:DUF805 domain-containing protein [Leptospirales bacterium]